MRRFAVIQPGSGLIEAIDVRARTSCAHCGAVIIDGHEEQADPAPCTSCGSTARTHAVVITESTQVADEALTRASHAGAMLLKTLLERGETTDEGAIIEAVMLPWFDIIRLIQKNPEAVYEISPRAWEEIVAGAYKRAGFDEVILTPHSGDRGRDVIATMRGIGVIRVIDQVKAYKPGHLVTANDVRALMGVLTADGASKGFLTTTSDFAPKLRDDPLIKPWISSRLELVNGAQLVSRLKELVTNS
jgi:restriction system protein